MAPVKETLIQSQHRTHVLQVDESKIGKFIFQDTKQPFLADWKIQLSEGSLDAANLQDAALSLQNSDTPVAFPTETVYGLGADATRSSAVRGIYNAKQRPSDNPLIVHISSLSQLRELLSHHNSSAVTSPNQDPITAIYHPLITKFWPGPLTILLPLPTPSPFASEVTANLHTIAVRMPSSRLALALIHLADRPLAAPSANASSKPSPTTAAHVLYDLAGRIDLILDGGPCKVGVESTVVDGLSNPPVILRPGGVSIDMLREVPGWEDVRVAYKDGKEEGAPRAPGMKYKHYSPNARVLLVQGEMGPDVARKYLGTASSVGLLTTKSWKSEVLQPRPQGRDGERGLGTNSDVSSGSGIGGVKDTASTLGEVVEALDEPTIVSIPSAQHSQIDPESQDEGKLDVWTIALGQDPTTIARGLFSALRELDQKGVEIIFVEGLDDREDGARAAIMDRLRKAAELEISL